MKAVLAPVGTRGDVQPTLALGVALVRAGHEVSVCVAKNYRTWVEAQGLSYVRGGADAKELMTRKYVEARGLRGSSKMARMLENGRVMLREQLATLEAAARGADLIVGTLLSTAVPSVAEHLGIPCFRACYFPASAPTAELPSVLFAKLRGPRWLNRATWGVHRAFENLGFRDLLNEYRVERKLRPIQGVEAHAVAKLTMLAAFDPEIAPLPGDWPAAAHATGYWFLDSDEPLPADVEEFLAAGDKPVYIGFGSMPSKDPAGRTVAIVDAVRKAGCRALIHSGWAGIGEAVRDPRCKVIGEVNHAALFPRLAAVVHHGGAGTTATTLRAGVPQVIVPHMFDQHYWGERMHASGVGPAPLPLGFTSDALAATLRAPLWDTTMRRQAEAVAERIRASQGTRRTVEALEERVPARGERHAAPRRAAVG